MYTVVNVGCNTEVKVVPAEGDSIEGDNCLYLKAGESVTLQNYKKTFYVVA